jgi:hypothetical protein
MQTGDHELCLLFVKWVWEHAVRERITARSTKFCNSRVLPGQEYHWKAAMVSGGMLSTCFHMRRLNRDRQRRHVRRYARHLCGLRQFWLHLR